MVDYPDKVNDAFLQQHDGGHLTRTQKMNKRYDVAKALLAEKYSHLTSELEEEAEKQYQADFNEWNLLLDSISLAANVSQWVAPFVPPLVLLTSSSVALAIPFSMPSIHSSKQLEPMPVAMFP